MSRTPGFTVDTHVFRELGELLVGRDSTALVELIKNSYDADATNVVVYGIQLNNVDKGLIVVSDDGVGMNAQTFTDGFLRIASRTKDVGSRRSARFKRRYTGAKGIGRLAAHKLARLLEVQSISGGERALTAIEARIDWDAIEEQETLDQANESDAISLKLSNPGATAKGGTRITLRRLRRKWSQVEHARFLEEIQGFIPPGALIEPLPPNVVEHLLLFGKPQFRDAQTESQFSVRLEGELAPPEDYWVAALQAAHWIVEIDALTKPGVVLFCIAPTRLALEDMGDFAVRRYRMKHPGGVEGPKFQARILLRTGRGDAKVRAWSGHSGGVRVYMEGFRVLPYGESSNDWLGLDSFYANRTNDPLSDAIAQAVSPPLDQVAGDRPGLSHLPNKHYFGAVFLTQRNAPSLRILVNREGFIPDAQYDQVVKLVRTGIDLTTRVRAVATASARQGRREERAKLSSPTGYSPLAEAPSFVAVLADAERHASAARRFTSAGDSKAAGQQLDVALAQIKHVTEASADLADQAAMLRVLASLGTQLSSFVHELNGLLGMTESIEVALKRLLEKNTDLTRGTKSHLNEIAKSISDLRRHIERQASYLIDVVSVDARRRRSRQRLCGRFDAAARLVQTAADLRGIQIVNDISPEIKSPPMFAAELTTVFANLLTNAIKAAGDNGRVRASSRDGAKGTTVRVENTGKAVNIRTSEKWFLPFESSTTNVDPVLGQGMGLGLTITRAMLDEYGASIRFTEPSRGFATAVEIAFNG